MSGVLERDAARDFRLQHTGRGSLQAVHVSARILPVSTSIFERAGWRQLVVSAVPIIKIHETQRIEVWGFEVTRRKGTSG